MILQTLVIIAVVAVATVASFRNEPVLAILLGRIAAFDVAREIIGRWVLRPERARLLDLVNCDEMRRAPFAGIARGLFHLDQAMYLAGPATVTAFAAWTFLRRPPFAAIAFAWAVISATVALLYPELSGLAWAWWPIGYVYRAAHASAALAAAVAFLVWFRRRERPELRHRVALALAGAELLVAFAGPYAWGGAQGVWTRWGLADLIYLATILWIGWQIWRYRDDARNPTGPH